jgi:ferredoxin-NADP reductase
VTNASSSCRGSATCGHISRSYPLRSGQHLGHLLQCKIRLDWDAAAKRVEHNAILLGAAEKPIRPLTLDVLRDANPGLAPDRRKAEVLAPLGNTSRVYVCGPTLLVEAAANSLVRLELPTDHIRTERFGPSGN